MLRKKIVLLCVTALIIISGLNVTAWAITGDCNNDATVNVSDANFILSWLFTGGALPNMPDCDCDGFPGLNFGDMIHIYDYVFGPTNNVYGYPSYDVPVPSLVKFYYNVPVPENETNFIVDIYIDAPPGFDLAGYIIPFSFAQQPGTMQAPLTCNSVDFTGTVANLTGGYQIDNINKYIIIYSVFNLTPTISGGSKGLLCSVDFTSGPGTPNPLTMTSTDKIWPMLFAQNGFAGVNGVRVFLPAAIRAQYGDVNCDGKVNVSDAVYIINYVFVPLSPEPGSCEPPE